VSSLAAEQVLAPPIDAGLGDGVEFLFELPISGEPNARFILQAAHVPSAGVHFGPVLSGLLVRGGTTVCTRAQR
jgi:hypothetical protein